VRLIKRVLTSSSTARFAFSDPPLGQSDLGYIVPGVGTDEPTVLPGDEANVLEGKDVQDPALERSREMLERLRAAMEPRHQKVTRLRSDVTELSQEIQKICEEREVLLAELATLRTELAQARERVNARWVPVIVQPPAEEPTAYERIEEPAGSREPDSSAVGRFRLRRRR
jgi:hypothetical protein